MSVSPSVRPNVLSSVSASVLRATCAALILAGLGLAPAGGEADGEQPTPRRLDLVSVDWTRNGEAHPGATPVDGLAGRATRLPYDGAGVRWAFRFETDTRTTWRLHLDWEPGPDGLLFELVIDGERLSPPRDGWRPTTRHLITDLGPRWLGTGDHLIEFVAREDHPDAALTLRALELRAP